MIELAYVIPAYNAERTVVETIESVLAQRGARVYVVVVDDGSSDGTADAARSTRDWRVEVVRQKNLGLAGARNTGLEVLEDRAEAVCFLDADDTVAGGHAAALCGALGTGTREAFDAAACEARMVGPRLEDLGWTLDVTDRDLEARRLLSFNPLTIGAVAMRVDGLRDRAGERPFVASRGQEDWRLFLRLAAGGCRWAPVVRRHLFNYRISAGSMSRSVEKMWRGGQDVIETAEGHGGDARAMAQRHWTIRHLARAAASVPSLVGDLLSDLDVRGGRAMDEADRAAFVGGLRHGFLMEHGVGPREAVAREEAWRERARVGLAAWEECHPSIEMLAFGGSEAAAERLARMLGDAGDARLVVAGMGRNGRGLASALEARGVGFAWYDDAADAGLCPVRGAKRVALAGIGSGDVVVVTPVSAEELTRRMVATRARVLTMAEVVRGEVIGRGERRRVA